jgi:hypothetical protein
MAQTSEAVSVISIRGQSVGLDKLASDVRAVDEAQKGVVASSEKVEQRSLSVERAYNRLQSRYDQAYRAQKELERVTRTLDQAQAQGLVSDQRRADILGIVAKRANEAAEAFAKIQASVGRDADIAAYGKALDDLRAKFNPLFAAGRQYKQTLAEISQAAKVGAITEAERSAAVTRTKDAFAAQVASLKNATSANDNLKKSHTGLSAEAQAAGHSVRSFIDSVAAGQSPTTALAQQIGNLQFAAGGRGGLSGALTEVGSTLRNLVTPATAAGAALAAAAVVAYTAWSRYDDMQRKVLGTLQGVGQGVGVTVQQFNAMAEAAAKAGNLSVDVARSGLNDLARTNQLLNPQLMVQLVSLTKNWAATYTDGNLERALSEITNLTKGGPEAIRDWLKAQNLLNPKLLEALDHAVRTRDANAAISALIEGTAGHLAKWDEVTSRLEKAWDRIKTSISDIRDTLGPLIEKAAGFVAGSLEGTADRLRRAAGLDVTAHPLVEATVANARAAPMATVGEAGVPSDVIQSWQRLTTTKKQAAQVAEQVAAAEAKIRPELTQTGAAIGKLDDDLRSAQTQLRDQLNESWNIGDRNKITEKLAGISDALKATDEAAKRSALSFAMTDNAMIKSAEAASDSTASKEAAVRAANKASTAVDDETKKLVSETQTYKDAKATLDLFADARRQHVKLTDDQIEAESRAQQIVKSQTDAQDRRITQEQHQAEVDQIAIDKINARTEAEKATVAVRETVVNQFGRSITRQQALNEQVEAGRRVHAEYAAQLRDMGRDLDMEAERIKLERDLLFASAEARARATAALAKEQELRRQGVNTSAPGAQALIKQAGGQAVDDLQNKTLEKGLQDAKNAASDFASSFAADMSHGVKAAEALTNAVKKLGDALISGGMKSLVEGLASGNFLQAGIGAAEVGVGFLSNAFGPSEKSKQRTQQMMDALAKQEQADFEAIQKQQQAVIDAGIASAKASEQAAEEATRRAEAATRRIESFSDRATMAGLDTTTLGGQLAALNLQQQREREQEVRDGGEALVALEAAQFAERERLLRDYTDKAILEEKRRFDEAKAFLDQFARTIQAFISGLQTGAQSPLSPADRLAAAQSQFSTQLSLAQGGDRDALNAITGNASTLLDAAKAFYASSQGFQDIYNTVVGQLGALPTQVSAEQLIVDAIDNQTQSLSDILNQLDTNGDGMISRQEAANTWLATIFNELDVNGDGQISRLELIRFATAGTETNVASTTASVDVTNSILSTQQALLSAVSANTNATVAGIQNDITQAGTLGTYTQKIVFNTASIASHEGAPAQFAVGGWVNGPGSGMSDSIRAMLSAGEFVVKADAAQSYGPMLEAMNAGRTLPAVPVANDNSGLFAALLGEVRTLTGRVGQLEASLVRATLGGAEHVREGVDNVAASHRDLVRETKKRAS